jgi:hypothetical protein
MLLWLLPPDVIATQTRIIVVSVWAAVAFTILHDLWARPAVRRLRWHVRVQALVLLAWAARRFPVLNSALIRALIPVLRKEPTMGYMNRVIDLQFPDLGGLQEGSDRAVIWLKIRNPKLMTGNDAFSQDTSNVQFGPDGQPVSADVKRDEVLKSFARLVIGGYVWDATVDSDDPPLIPMPPTPEDMGRMPMEILNAIADELKKANPK